MKKKTISELIQTIDFFGLRELARQNDLDWLVIYGSRVFGKPNKDSDLDIGYDGPLPTLNIALELVSGLEVDVHCAKEVNPGVRYGMTKGVLVYERENGIFNAYIKQTKKDFREYIAKLKRQLEDDLDEGYIVIQSPRAQKSTEAN